MGKFVNTIRKNGEFQFNLKADNGQVILSSEGYTTKAARDNGIESVRNNAPDDNRYDRKRSSNDKYYFNLKATNGQVIGTSEARSPQRRSKVPEPTEGPSAHRHAR